MDAKEAMISKRRQAHALLSAVINTKSEDSLYQVIFQIRYECDTAPLKSLKISCFEKGDKEHSEQVLFEEVGYGTASARTVNGNYKDCMAALYKLGGEAQKGQKFLEGEGNGKTLEKGKLHALLDGALLTAEETRRGGRLNVRFVYKCNLTGDNAETALVVATEPVAAELGVRLGNDQDHFFFEDYFFWGNSCDQKQNRQEYEDCMAYLNKQRDKAKSYSAANKLKPLKPKRRGRTR